MRIIAWAATAFLLTAALFLAYFTYSLQYVLSSNAGIVIIPSGYSVKHIANLLAEKQIIHDKDVFVLFAKWQQLNNKASLIAGEYQFESGITTIQVIKKLIRGDVIIHKITIPEGATSFDIVSRLHNAYGIITANIATMEPKEGSLLPETYLYTYGQSMERILEQMTIAMNKFLEAAWLQRDPNIDSVLSSKQEALILASIIEKETSRDEERSRVAAVYLNRLRKSMPLQADPTVLYGITRGQGVLNRKLTFNDLHIKSEYNTYKNTGLPPTAICNPGKASIEAALHPMSSNELYFVADGNGGHYFATAFAEHLENVKKYRVSQQR